MKRTTPENWRDLEAWEICGLEEFCPWSGDESRGCLTGCMIPKWFRGLAAYEDTGLEPEEIFGLCSMSNRAKMADLLRLEEYQALGSVDHLREIEQAEKDGRLVVLPCKVGDTVYIIRDKKIFIAKVETLHQWVGGVWKLNAYTDKRYSQWIGYEVFFNDFGKTVFLTREEAEAALKKREADDEAD